MNQEKNKKQFGAKYILLGIFIMVYIILVFNAVYASIHDLYAMYMSLFVDVTLGVILSVVSLVVLKKDLTAEKREKLVSLFGAIFGVSAALLSIVWFLFWKSQLGY